MTFEPTGNALSLQPPVLCESTNTTTVESGDALSLGVLLEELVAGSEQLAMIPLSERIRLVEAVLKNVVRVSRECVYCSSAILQIEPTDDIRS